MMHLDVPTPPSPGKQKLSVHNEVLDPISLYPMQTTHISSETRFQKARTHIHTLPSKNVRGIFGHCDDPTFCGTRFEHVHKRIATFRAGAVNYVSPIPQTFFLASLLAAISFRVPRSHAQVGGATSKDRTL